MHSDAAAATVESCRPKRSRRLALAIATVLGVAGPTGALATELPIPCVSGACAGVTAFVTSGQATASASGPNLTIVQSTDFATLNWQRFDIGANGKVEFRQPDASSIALNRIFQNDASRIFGSLQANGRVFLLNQNGFLFGNGARVNVGGLLASTLQITPEALERGIAGAGAQSRPAFEQYRDPATGALLPSGGIVVAEGAQLDSPGGQILLFAPEIVNRGRLSTPDGQTILAAGDAVYLATSADPNLRGLLVEVGLGGSVTNGVPANATAADAEALIGQIVAERGNVTLAGLAVNQLGRVSATTSVRQNGSVRLLARGDATAQPGAGSQAAILLPRASGELVVGSRSSTAVTLDLADTSTSVDATVQPRSRVELDGRDVRVLGGARLEAPGGTIDVVARADPAAAPGAFTSTPDESRLYVAPGATLNVAGADIALPMERNVLRVELRGNQLSDSPAQRDGVLRGEAVFVDVRRGGVRADGTEWRGSPIGDLGGDIAGIARGVGERNLEGGSVRLRAQGELVVADGAVIDVSGGRIAFGDGFLDTTQLLADGRYVDIADADRDVRYDAILSRFVETDPRWGTSRNFDGLARDPRGTFEAGYVEGRDAGSLTLSAPRAVFDGALLGATTAGRYQRLPPDATLQHQRLPQGGQLIVGNPSATQSYVVQQITIAPGLVLPGLASDGVPFDPERDRLPESYRGIALRPELLGDGAARRVTLQTVGSLTVPTEIAVDLGPFGAFTATAGRIDFAGRLAAAGGTVRLTAEPTPDFDVGDSGILVGAGAVMDTAGRWVNDGPQLNAGALPSDAIPLDGGSIELTARQGDLVVEGDALLDVSGGAWLQRDGRFVDGAGGRIALAATPRGDAADPTVLRVDGTLLGYGFHAGGELGLAGRAFCIAAAGCADDGSVVAVDPAFFQRGGFARYQLASNVGGVDVLAGTRVRIEQYNRELSRSPLGVASGTAFADFTRVVRLPDALRQPASLSLRANVASGGAPFDAARFASAPGLTIGAGAVLETDPGGGLALRSNTRLIVDGALAAPAGTVRLELDATLPVQQFLDAQAIWLGSRARVDVGGVAKLALDPLGRRRGDVLAGGSVVIEADRGYLVALPGSVLDASGTQAELDVLDARGLSSRRALASDGGSIAITVAEGALLGGTLAAHAGGTATLTGALASGGRLALTLDAEPRRDDSFLAGAPSVFPLSTPRIVVAEGLAPVTVAPGSAVPRGLNGLVLLDPARVADGGFGSVSLTALSLAGRSASFQSVQLPGTIAFEGPTTLAAPLRIALDAPVIAADSRARVVAPYVQLGQTNRIRQFLDVAPTGGGGELEVQGEFVELAGALAIQGADTVRIESGGDLRLRGLQPRGGTELTGSLRVAGDLELAARQIYPSTLSRYVVEAGDAIRVRPVAGARGDVYSAAGALELRAPRIEQGGVLRAPLGTVTLTATDRLELRAGSTTSASADGAVIPFGTTQGGFDWVYELDESLTLLFGTLGRAVPSGTVVLDAPDVDLQAGATIDVSGGGDLLAYEFVPGVGGTRDVLSNLVEPQQFAVVPGLSAAVAPFDPRENRGVALGLGDAVYLDGVEGLPPGVYTLLPARYALLPGAFLVEPASGFADLPRGQRIERADGAVVVAGHRVVNGLAAGDTRSSGFAIRPGAAARNQAAYTTSTANEFFAGTPQRLPKDAGVLALVASRSLALDGTLRALPAGGGRGGAVDVSSERLLVAPPGTVADPGVVLLSADSLERLAAQSLFIGGRRSVVGDATRLDVTARRVTVAPGTRLRGAELLLAATEELLVDVDAELAASAATPATGAAGDAALDYVGSGDGALLRVAAGPQARFERSATPGLGGDLVVREGARIAAPGGALFADASRGVVFDGTLSVAGGSLALGASRIGLGAVPADASGLRLDAAVLESLFASELVLSSRSSLDLYGVVALETDRLVIDAAGIRGGDGVDGTLVAREALVLRSTSTANLESVAGGGTLRLAAPTVELDGGAFRVGGIAELRVDARDNLRLADGAALATSGAMTVAAGTVVGTSGANAELSADGELVLAGADAGGPLVAAAAPTAAGIGAQLTLTGRSIVQSGRVDLPGGSARYVATGPGGIAFASGGTTRVAGEQRSYDGVPLAIPGGTIRLESAGDVTLAAGSALDLGPAGDAPAGALAIIATDGRVAVEGTLVGGPGGAFEADARTYADATSLLAQVAATGFSSRIALRQRGPGDVLLAADTTLAAREIALGVDAGRLRIPGAIDARGEHGGAVRLAARDDVEISGRIDARATGPDGRGGRVEVGSTTGGVRFAGGSRVDLAPAPGGSGSGGELVVRAPRAAFATLLDADAGNDALRLDGELLGARRIVLEGVATYQDTDGILTAPELAASAANPRWAEALAFSGNAGAILAALGVAERTDVHVRPGVEIRAAGDLRLAADWNLAPWRFGDQPGVLTLRAGGNLVFDRSLSDGFAGVTGTNAFLLPTVPGDSWSYRLVGGADFAAASPLATATASTGSVRIAGGTLTPPQSTTPSALRMVRTGTGTIDVAAAGDVVLTNQASVIYTAGVAGPGLTFGTRPGTLQRRAYPVDGGDVTIRAGRDVLGARTSQLVTEWLWRVGRGAEVSTPSATAWTVNFQRFEQNVGALAGGLVGISAGRDVVNLSASIPSIGRQVGGELPGASVVEVVGGGELRVAAGRDVLGGSYFVGRGLAELSAGGAVRQYVYPELEIGALYPVLALGDAAMRVTARQSLGIETIVTPTLLPQGRSQNASLVSSFFSTYGPDSRVDLLAVAGDVDLSNRTNTLPNLYASLSFPDAVPLRIYPPSLRAVAFDGSIAVGGGFTLFPAPKGNLELYAERDVSSRAVGGAQIILSDVDPARLPTPAAPGVALDFLRDTLTTSLTTNPNFRAAIPVHADVRQPDGVPDLTPARVVARTGDVSFPTLAVGDNPTVLWFAKPVRIVAGRDVVDVSIAAQNLRAGDVTSVVAGRDFRYSNRRTGTGQVAESLAEFVVDGPGRVLVQAGRDVDLQTSGGITSRGNVVNAALADEGASIHVLAGVEPARYDDAAFIARYLEQGATHDAALADFLAEIGVAVADKPSSLSALRALTPERRRPLVERVLLAELRAAGREAAATGSGDFTAAFEALEALYPGSNPDLDAGERNAWEGGIRLFFSRIYTLDGGDITLLAPGGEVNVGLAAPPVAFGIAKTAAQLGVVAQASGSVGSVSFGDFQVNESRVFAADGGDILVWSTRGDIDAGRGAKTAISAPPPTIIVDDSGRTQIVFPAALSGSGIQTLATSEGREPGDVDLFAPRGVVNAGDAGIVAGNLTIAATAVLGAANIAVSGSAVGVPVDTGGLAGGIAGLGQAASSATSGAAASVEQSAQGQGDDATASLADVALGWLEVFVIGLGEEQCRPDDLDCLRRARDE